MAIYISNGVTTIKPTAWKWYAGAGALALIAFVIPDYGWAWGLVALFLAAFGSGRLASLKLDRKGIYSKHMFGTKYYTWDAITDFRLMKVKSGLFTAATMVSFTKVSQQGSLYAKAAKFVSGGTHSLPAYGIKAKTLITLMTAYQQGLIISDEIVAKVLGKAKFTKVPASPERHAANVSDISPQKSKRQYSSAMGDMSAADRAMREAAAQYKKTGRSPAPQKTAPQKATPQPTRAKFGPTPKGKQPKAVFGKAGDASSPLVQDSSARRRRIG